MTFPRQRLLIVTPEFHGYWQSIERAFAELGYEVQTHLYDAAAPREKLYNKLRHELPAQITGSGRHLSDAAVTDRALRALNEARPDLVLVVRGRLAGKVLGARGVHAPPHCALVVRRAAPDAP